MSDGAGALLVDHDGVLTGPGSEHVWRLVAEVRAAGHPTGVVSNAYGFGGFTRRRLAAMFDVLLASGEVGVAKPDPAMFALAVERVGVAAHRCVFVDDHAGHVAGAVRAGLVGVHHTDWWSTQAQVRAAFGL